MEDLKASCTPVPAQVLISQHLRDDQEQEYPGKSASDQNAREQNPQDLPVINLTDLLLRGSDHIEEPHLTDVSRHRDLHHIVDQEEHAAQDSESADRRHFISSSQFIHRAIRICVRY